ncbi:hypothetical protein PG988_007450 [Apiospora saccharicola]
MSSNIAQLDIRPCPVSGTSSSGFGTTIFFLRGQAGAQVLLVRQALGAMAIRTDHVAADKEAEAAQLASLEEAVGGGVLEEGQQRRGSGSVRCIQGAAGRVGLAQTALAASTKQVMQRHITYFLATAETSTVPLPGPSPSLSEPSSSS